MRSDSDNKPRFARWWLLALVAASSLLPPSSGLAGYGAGGGEAMAQGCQGGIDGDEGESEAAASGSGSPTTPAPPGVPCEGATCFRNATGPRRTHRPAVVATSSNIHGAIGANGQTRASAAQFTNSASTLPVVDIIATGSDATAVSGIATNSAQTAGVGVYAEARSPAGIAGKFISTEGDLIVGKNSINGPYVFRVTNEGKIYVGGELVAEQGPTGPTGQTGPKGHEPKGNAGAPGDQGPKGDAGPAGRATSVAICAQGSTCIGKCPHRLIAMASGDCTVASDAGSCTWGGVDGVCCVCSR